MAYASTVGRPNPSGLSRGRGLVKYGDADFPEGGLGKEKIKAFRPFHV